MLEFEALRPTKSTDVCEWKYLQKLRGQTLRQSYEIEYAFCQGSWNVTINPGFGAWNVNGHQLDDTAEVTMEESGSLIELDLQA